MSPRDITIRFPVSGVAKRLGFQQQPPFTAADALNVWPDDVVTGRSRGGSRPGLSAIGADSLEERIDGMFSAVRAASGAYERPLFVLADGELFELDDGEWTSRGTGAGSGRRIHMAAQLQNLFIASDTYKYLPFSTNTLGGWQAAVTSNSGGTIPTNNTMIVSWQDRIVLAGDPESPHTFFMSKKGDPFDWNVGVNSPDSAVSGTEIEGGQPGEAITALITHNRHCILFGCTDSIWVLRGDPVSQRGSLEVVDHQVGVLCHSAWCKTADDYTVFLSRNGLYTMQPGCGSTPIAISRELLPEELIGIDPSTTEVSLAWDQTLRAVHIWLTPASGTGTHWLFDWDRKGFWPVRLGDDEFQPTCVCEHTPTFSGRLSTVLLGDGVGGIRRFDRDAYDDDGEPFTSHVVAGPLKISPTIGDNAKILESQLVSTAISGSSPHTYSVFAGDTAELAAAGDRSFSAASTTYRGHPSLHGHAACLKVASTGDPWFMEEARLRVRQAGRLR